MMRGSNSSAADSSHGLRFGSRTTTTRSQGGPLALPARARAGAWSTSCVIAVVTFMFTAGCPTPVTTDAGVDAGVDVVDAGAPAVAVSTRNHLIWKRARALEQGLGASLLLSENNVCKELGRTNCVDGVHLVALGGNDPFEQGMHEPMGEPTATTPVAMERVALAACQNAVDADAARPTPLLFLDLNLAVDAPILDVNDRVAMLAVEDSSRRVGQRVLARDLRQGEVDLLKTLATDDAGNGLRPRDFAVLMCFSLTTLSETVFF